MKKITILLIVLAITGFAGCDKAMNAEPDPLEDAKAIVPEEYLNLLIGLGMPMYGGTSTLNIKGAITQETPIVFFDSTDKKKEGDKLKSHFFGITRQTGREIRLLTGPHSNLEINHRMSGDGTLSSPDGDNFTIYAKTEGLGARGRREYKIIYILSGYKDGNIIKNFQYAYIVVENQGVGFIEEAGTVIVTQYGEANWYP